MALNVGLRAIRPRFLRRGSICGKGRGIKLTLMPPAVLPGRSLDSSTLDCPSREVTWNFYFGKNGD
ncbi:MAG: hypothetical protein P4L68_01785 [Methylovirgula sp.]|nr:hypothetical protein [Methylovirgula sp.]